MMRKRGTDCAYDLEFNRNNRRVDRESMAGKESNVEAESGNWVYSLALQINLADGVDAPILYPSLPMEERNYCVIFWVDSQHKYVTNISLEPLEPVWRETMEISLGRYLDPEFLSVEVIRVNAWSDPGPSDGVVLVGRARIPVPGPSAVLKKKTGRFGLVRLVRDGYRGEGHISISMELKRAHLAD